jgi:hypothetical protein
MPPIVIAVVALGVAMAMGIPATLAIARRSGRSVQAAVRRWHLQGSVPLAAAGLVLGVVSRQAGQSPVTYDVTYVVAGTLLFAAFLLALAGASAVTRSRQQGDEA